MVRVGRKRSFAGLEYACNVFLGVCSAEGWHVFIAARAFGGLRCLGDGGFEVSDRIRRGIVLPGPMRAAREFLRPDVNQRFAARDNPSRTPEGEFTRPFAVVPLSSLLNRARQDTRAPKDRVGQRRIEPL